MGVSSEERDITYRLVPEVTSVFAIILRVFTEPDGAGWRAGVAFFGLRPGGLAVNETPVKFRLNVREKAWDITSPAVFGITDSRLDLVYL